MESEVRQRRKRTNVTRSSQHGPRHPATVHAPQPDENAEENGAAPETARGDPGRAVQAAPRQWFVLPACVSWLSMALGLSLLVAASVTHATYMFSLHENDLWFSNIKVG